MPQFVILHHQLPPASERADHFDLMFEDGDSLVTWAIAELPSDRPQAAAELAPHRREYLTYEGPVSQNRGRVERVAAGSFEWLQRNELHWVAALQSTALTGELHLKRAEEKTWRLWMIRPGNST